MIVTFEDAIWSDNAVNPLDLLSVLATCMHRRHQLLLPRGSGTTPGIDEWIEQHMPQKTGARQRLVKLVEVSRRTGHQAGKGVKITVVAGRSDGARRRFCVQDAARLLERPLRLLVENARNDRAFLLKVLEPSARRELNKALELGWVEFEMGGGITEIKCRLEDLKSADDISRIINRGRLWVMFDRDAHADDRSLESEQSRALREVAAQISTPWPLVAHQLERRAIENYVPVPVIRRWWCFFEGKDPESRHKKAEAFAKLAPEVRHNFNMKGGLLSDLRVDTRKKDRSVEQLTDVNLDPLYRQIAIEDREHLKDGFPQLAKAFSEGVIQDNELHHEVSRPERRRLIETIRERM